MKLGGPATDMKIIPEKYTVWFKIAFERVREYLKGRRL